MQSDSGKLFIGGISWDTNEERLKEYFSSFGEVVEAVIMKDRTTGRARGFGFVVFSDPAVADNVIMEKHNIGGRMVEAKKAVPRDDQNILGRSSGSIQGSPGPGRTRKIFVGGLASTVTESDFKKYFEQFGTITDVVVMYDHNTQRPRGFGFITYDSEEAVDKVLLKTFHELNGKMVEVKRAVPKELSPGPSRSPLGGYNYGLSRVNSFLNGYTQGYNPSTVGGYGLGRYSPVAGGRSGFPPYGSGYGIGINYEPGLSPGFGGNANFNSTMSYGRGLSPYYINVSNRFSSPIGYDGNNGGNTSSFFSSVTQNLWGNGNGSGGGGGVVLIMERTPQMAMLTSDQEVGPLEEVRLEILELIGLLQQCQLKAAEVMLLTMAGILVMESGITVTVWELEGMEETVVQVWPLHLHLLHQMVVVLMVPWLTFTVVIQFMETLLGDHQIPIEMDLVPLVMGLAVQPLMFQLKVLLVMLVVIVLIRDSQIQELLPRIVISDITTL